MQSARRRSSTDSGSARRAILVIATLTAFGGGIAVTHVSSAATKRFGAQQTPQRRAAAGVPVCGDAVPGANNPRGERITYTQENGRQVRHHWGDGQECRPAPGAAGSSSAKPIG